MSDAFKECLEFMLPIPGEKIRLRSACKGLHLQGVHIMTLLNKPFFRIVKSNHFWKQLQYLVLSTVLRDRIFVADLLTNLCWLFSDQNYCLKRHKMLVNSLVLQMVTDSGNMSPFTSKLLHMCYGMLQILRRCNLKVVYTY